MNARENYSILHGEASFSGTLCASCFCITGQSTAMSAPPKDGKTGHHPPASICFHEVALSWAAGVASVAIADAKQAQQTGEQVKERDEQANRGQHVIGFPAVHDAAGFKQDQSCR